MTEAELDRWMSAYGEAYEARDPAAGAALFAPEATYQWGPFGPFRHEIVACTEDVGVARWLASLPGLEIDGIFAVRLGDDGLCREFREWWNSRPS